MNFFEKLQVGWWWCLQIFEEWYYTMTHPEDDGRDFFCHLQTDYVAYEEDLYYD